MKVLFRTNYQIINLLDASAHVISNYNSFTVESCDTRKNIKYFQKSVKKCQKLCLQLYSENDKIIFFTNAVALYVRKVKAIYILTLQCKKY